MSATAITARPAAALVAKSPRLSAVAWAPPHELAHQQWLVEGKRIGAMSRGSAWWIGDWLLYGAARWGERYAEASRVTGYDPKTLRNMRYVASRFHLSLRKDNLTFSHHALVAGLDSDQQCHWLDRATHDRMSVEDLRIELRTARQEAERPDRWGDDQRSRVRPPRPAAAPPQSAPSMAAADDAGDMILCPHCGEGIPVTQPLS